MRVLVLGGTRFSGPFVVRELAAAGHELMVFHRGEHNVELPAEQVYGDFADFGHHVDRLRAFEPDTVVDMFALRSQDAARVGAFTRSARHAVVLSSADVYRAFGRISRSEPGPPDPVPLTEDSPLRKQVVEAGYDKVGVEAALREVDLPVTVLRLGGVYGPGDFQHRLWSYVKRMDDSRPAIVIDETLSRWRFGRAYVEDAAHATALAATDESAVRKTYNVASENACTEAEWISTIAASVGWQGRVVAASSTHLPDYLREDGFDLRQDFVLDSSRIRRELGYREVVEEAEALRRTVEWERANPPTSSVDRFDYDAEDGALARLGARG
jgi:nucleoside-diphosphate-sugar epimerase